MGIVAADEHGVITTFNEKAQEILGYSAAEATQIDVRQVYDDPQEPIRVKHALRLSPTGADVRDTLVRSKTGEVIPIRLSAAALGATEQARGTVGYFEDLRPIKDTTRRLQLLAEVSDVMARPDHTIEGLSKLARIVSSLYLVASAACCCLTSRQEPSWLGLRMPTTKVWQPAGDRRSARSFRWRIETMWSESSQPAWPRCSTRPMTMALTSRAG